MVPTHLEITENFEFPLVVEKNKLIISDLSKVQSSPALGVTTFCPESSGKTLGKCPGKIHENVFLKGLGTLNIHPNYVHSFKVTFKIKLKLQNDNKSSRNNPKHF